MQDIATLATFNKSLGELNDAAIYVKDNVIEWVGKTADLPSSLKTADKVVALPEHVVHPGLVNTHHHMFQCITRCVAQVTGSSVSWAFVEGILLHVSPLYTGQVLAAKMSITICVAPTVRPTSHYAWL